MNLTLGDIFKLLLLGHRVSLAGCSNIEAMQIASQENLANSCWYLNIPPKGNGDIHYQQSTNFLVPYVIFRGCMD